MIRVMLVCHGNICRSTMAQCVFADMVQKRNIADNFIIESAGTSTEEIGNPIHRGTVNKLVQVGINIIEHRAVQLKKSDLEKYDYFIAMDSANVRNMKKILGNNANISLLLEYTNSKRDIADPWYTGNFDETYNDIVLGLEGFLNYLGY
ncbi:low molecular weight phosphotyrosine protein phosphatase [Peptostreptococcaceae bacterium oral taxon 081]|nr:low molecular weight phosphotyrosine protein phosphatase [Peptostreptococcaceae bacterium oral taxon 081]